MPLSLKPSRFLRRPPRGLAIALSALLVAGSAAMPAAAKGKPVAHKASGSKAQVHRGGSHKGGVVRVSSGHGRWHGAWRDKAGAKARVGAAAAAAAASAAKSAAQPAAPRPVVATAPVAPAAPANQALVSVAAGGVTSTSARIASDMSSVLDSDALRVLPVMSRGSLNDLLMLAQSDKADLAFLHSDALSSLAGPARAAIANRLAYVARLYNEEVHVVASREIGDIHDLAGKKVNVGLAGSANAQTAQLIFDRLGIAPYVVNLDQPTALVQLAAGEIAADVLVSGRPVKALQDFAGDGRFKLLPVPYEAGLQDVYLPARIEAVDYGNLVPPGKSVDTLAVPIVLATVDAPQGSPRAARVQRFTQALFERFDALRDPTRHPKWREVNLAADVADWNRFGAAQAAIEATTMRSANSGASLNTPQPASDSQSSPQPTQDIQQWKLDKAN